MREEERIGKGLREGRERVRDLGFGREMPRGYT